MARERAHLMHPSDEMDVLARDEFTCAYCGGRADGVAFVDPAGVHRHGAHQRHEPPTISNTHAACGRCAERAWRETTAACDCPSCTSAKLDTLRLGDVDDDHAAAVLAAVEVLLKSIPRGVHFGADQSTDPHWPTDRVVVVEVLGDPPTARALGWARRDEVAAATRLLDDTNDAAWELDDDLPWQPLDTLPVGVTVHIVIRRALA